MNKKIPRTIHQNSVEELSMSNGINGNQSDWSRCNSFSSSSNDSAVFCSSHLQRPKFPRRKRLASVEHPTTLSKRNRNSSGSSASSNLSCFSDKDTKTMPTLMSAESISIDNTSVGNLTNLSSISSTTLALQHEALLNNRLSHSISMDTVLPFRHNLRRNIRKKTCSCDCTATCTTVVVSRQYKGLGQKTVEEKTVISRTKVKTYVERNPSQVSTVGKVQTSENVSFTENSSHKKESNRKRRSEIEKLYDSLHEIKWAKNFSPDNILRQFDVRQAASCSVFGRSPEDKSNENPKSPNRQKNSCNQNDKTLPKKCSKSTPPLNRSNSSYLTRSRSRLSTSTTSPFKRKKDSSPPVLEKSVLENANEMDNDSTNFSSYPLLSKEMFTPEKGLSSELNKTSKGNFEYSADFNAIQTSCSSCKSVDNFPTNLLAFDLKSQTNIDDIESINNCTFFNIAEEEICTIDACFREVGAEVVVSTCYETDYKLPLLTSVEENGLEETSVSDDTPPLLVPLLSKESYRSQKLSSGISCDIASYNGNNLSSELNSVRTNHSLGSTAKPLSQPFFPLIDSKSLPEEDYTLPDSCINSAERICSVKCFHKVKSDAGVGNDVKPLSSLPYLTSAEETNSLEQNSNFDPGPPVLEPCLESLEQKFPIKVDPENSSRENLNIGINGKFKTDSKINCISESTYKIKKLKKNCNNANQRLRTKSLVIVAGRRILNKYLKLLRFKSTNQHMPNKILKDSENNVGNSNALSRILRKNQKLLNENLPTLISSISISRKNYPHISESVGCVDVPFKSPPRITGSVVKKESCISQSVETCRQTSDADGATVIRTFDQKMSFSGSPETVTLNQVSNSSIFFQSKTEPNAFSTVRTKRGRKTSILNSSSQQLENMPEFSGYAKILADSKKKEDRSSETTVKVPARVFTCHYQTINVTHGNNYIQIVLKITRGKSVFLTRESLVELKEAITKAGKDNDCRLLILNGFGETFCLGLDLRPIVGERKNQAVGEIANAVKDLISTLAKFHKPLVAIVNGAAFGLGLTLLNHADVTLATNNASFCMPYSKLGYMPEGGATLTLPQAVGTTVAMDLILRGREITAQQARDIGLINEVVEIQHLPKDLVRRVQTMAENSVSGMETTKAMIKMRLHIQLPLVLETETKLLPQMWLSPSCQEAIQSALASGFLADC